MTHNEFIRWARMHVDREWSAADERRARGLTCQIATYDSKAADLFDRMRSAENDLEIYLRERYPEVSK